MTYFTRLMRANSKGATLIEFAFILTIVCLLVVGMTTLIAKAVDANKVHNLEPHVSLAQAPPAGLTRSGKKLKEEGPTEYQLEILRKANEATAQSSSSTASSVKTKSPQAADVTAYQLEVLRKANEAHAKSISSEMTNAAVTKQNDQLAVTENSIMNSAAVASPVGTTSSKERAVERSSWSAIVEGSHVSMTIRTTDTYATIHWGDGSTDNIYPHGSFSGTHSYSSPGPHEIQVTGKNFEVVRHATGSES